MANNGIQIENSPNILIITDSDQNQITVTQPVVGLVEVSALGPQGQKGDQGDSIFQLVSGSTYSTTSSLEVSGSFTVSGSSTFKNIGPAIFSGSVTSTQGFTGSLFGTSSYALTASYAMNGGSGGGGYYIATGSVSASVGLGTGSFVVTSGSSNLFTVDNAGAFTASAALITGNVTVLGTASINTLIVNQTQLSTGSNQLGDASNDFQTLYGTVRIPTGSLTVTGSTIISGSLNIENISTLKGSSNYFGNYGISGTGSSDNYIRITDYDIASFSPGISFYANGVKRIILYRGGGDQFVTRISSVDVSSLFGTGNLLLQTGGTHTDAGFRLDVNGTGRFSGNLTITGSATNSLLIKGSGTTSATTALLVQNANATPSLVVLDNGFVGIGTGSAAYNLDVSGSIRSTSDLFINGSARLRYDSNNNISLFGGINFTSGQQNLVIGTSTGFNINSGFYNTLLGHNAGQGLYSGTGNTFVGWRTGGSINPGNAYNSFLGYEAGRLADTSYSVFLGYQAGYSEATTNKLYIANSSTATPLIGGDFTRGRVGINVPPTGISASLHISGAASTSSAALLVYKSGSTVVDVQGSSGQLFSITDSLTGSLFSVNTVAGLPVMEAFSDNTVNIGKFGTYPIKVAATGTLAIITGSLFGSATTASYVNPLTQSLLLSGSANITGITTVGGLRGITDYSIVRSDNSAYINFYNAPLIVDFTPAATRISSGRLESSVNGSFGFLGASPVRLHVRGAGTTSATTAFQVDNTNSTASLVVLDNGFVGINTGSAAYNLDVNGTARVQGKLTVSTGGVEITGNSLFTGLLSANSATSFFNSSFFNSRDNFYGGGNFNLTTGYTYVFQAERQFQPSSGNATYVSFYANPLINQTGGANGITRGIYVNPTLTSAADFRAIETTSGSVILNGGRVSISGSAGNTSALTVYKSGSTVVDIQGSQGQLFSITDSLSGSLFSVSNISGLPILEVFSDNSVVMGSYTTPAMVITGSNTIISGSLRGRVVTLSTSSATASMDCSLSNFFDLTLSGSMYLTPTNIQPGETINLRITQPATSGSLNYSSSIKFPNGLPYTASATASVVDLISFISFDSSTLYATSLKNLV